MKILTIGQSPFLKTSSSVIHNDIIKYLSDNGHEVSCAAYDHDSNYFVFDDENVVTLGEHKIEFWAFTRGDKRKENSSFICDLLKENSFDFVLTVGPIEHFVFMHVVKSNTDYAPWIAVSTNSNNSLTPQLITLLSEANRVIFTSRGAHEKTKDTFESEWKYVGVDELKCPTVENKYSAFCMSRNYFEDAPVTALEAACLANESTRFSLYMHCNIHDKGFYEIESFIGLLDKNECVSLPDEYTSVKDGCSNEDLWSKMASSSLFIRTGIKQNTCISLFESMSCGCIPIVPEDSVDHEILKEIDKSLNIYFVTFQTVPFWGYAGEKLLIPDVMSLKKALIDVIILCENKEWKEGQSNKLSKISSVCSRKDFLESVQNLLVGADKKALSLL